MKFFFTLIILVFVWAKSFSQVQELEEFKRTLTISTFFEAGRIDTIVKSEENSILLRKQVHSAFMNFVNHPQSNNLENLKSLAKSKGNTYWFDVYSYDFTSTNFYFDLIHKNPEIRNPVHRIFFSGLYNYGEPNFISIFIQEFKIRDRQYAVYYYNSLKNGVYYIKDVAENRIVFESELKTFGAPIYRIDVLDKKNILVIEDMEDWGQRALVLNTSEKIWTKEEAFKGNKFVKEEGDFKSKEFSLKRVYFKLASHKDISSLYGMGFSTNNRIVFDPKTLTISYKKVLSNGTTSDVVIEAKWNNNQFAIDDYFLGEKMDYSPPPMPD